MEIMIQTKRHMFSFGTFGYRKVTQHDWDSAWETFEALMGMQTGKMIKKSDKLKKATKDMLKASRGPTPTWDTDDAASLPSGWGEKRVEDLYDPAFQGEWPEKK